MKRILKRALKKILNPSSLMKSKRITEYKSFEEAMKHADGYETEILAKVVVAKGKKFAKQFSKTKQIDLFSLRTFIGLASTLKSKKLTVLDFGGAAGTHYFIARSVLSKDIILDWRVVETSQMVQEAQKQGLENIELKFFSSIIDAVGSSKINLVFASSSIHYTPKPYEFLRLLANIDADILMITRTPIDDVPAVLLQHSALSDNGFGKIPSEIAISDKTISYPVSIMDRKIVEEILEKFGDIRLKVMEDKINYEISKKTYDMWGYVVSRK